jgi:hypothetical protein
MVVFSKHQKRRAVGLLLLGGGAIVVGGRLLQLQIRAYQKEQNALCELYLTKAASKQPISRKPKVAVNARFAGRLGEILQICVPSVFSKEALFILVQSCLLVNRTLLTDRISVLEGISAEAVITKVRSLQFIIHDFRHLPINNYWLQEELGEHDFSTMCKSS